MSWAGTGTPAVAGVEEVALVALLNLTQAKAYLRVNAAASLRISAEYVGVGDDSDTTFDLANTPVDGSLLLYVDGTLQVEGTDFTISGVTVTFDTAPASPDPITASYNVAASANTFDSYDDELLEMLIAAATKKAEDYTGRVFVQREITEDHIGDGSLVLKLYKQPVDSIDSVVRLISEAIATGDGSTTGYDLDEAPTSGRLSLYADGSLQTLDVDYTLSGSTITFTSAPSDGVKITAEYTHTILPINEYTNKLAIGRLIGIDVWTEERIYRVVYTAGYAASVAATQALVPNVVSAVLLILANLYENRTDALHGENISGVGSVTYELPLYSMSTAAMVLLSPYRVNIL